MKNKEAIRQLEDLKDHCSEMATSSDNAAWKKDTEALTKGIIAIKEKKILNDIIKKDQKDIEKLKLALFGTIRNSTAMPIGIIMGKSMQEINKMSVETMNELLNKNVFEWDKMKKSFEEGGGEF